VPLYKCHSVNLYTFGAGIIFLILEQPEYEVWIIQDPNTLEFETNCIFKRKSGEYIQCLKYSVLLLVKYKIKMQI